jgi:hypothetical protein
MEEEQIVIMVEMMIVAGMEALHEIIETGILPAEIKKSFFNR